MSGFLDDLGAMVVSSVYVLAVLGLAEFLRRRGVARSTTRKIVHIGIGTWIVPTFLIFEHRTWAVVPAACFIVVNAASYRWNLIRSVEGEARNIGTILYPMSVALTLLLSFGTGYEGVGAASILVLAWGDAAASLVGRRHGRHVYRVLGHPRSFEGSAAMFVASAVAVVVAIQVLGAPPGLSLWPAFLIAAMTSTAVEGLCLWGLDNLLVPAACAAALLALAGGGGL